METDFYKFTMWQLFLHKFPSNHAVYRFKCRTPVDRRLFDLKSLVFEINQELDNLCSLSFKPQDLQYLENTGFFKQDFLEFLRNFKFNRAFIEAKIEDNDLFIEAKGPQVQICGFEIPVLVIVNELYFRKILNSQHFLNGQLKLEEKIKKISAFNEILLGSGQSPLQIFDFGLRRRAASSWHLQVLETVLNQKNDAGKFIKGTSNVRLAQELNLKPIGTMAHEYLQTFQAAPVQLRLAQKEALNAWIEEYQGDLSIALTDVISMKAFLNDFNKPLAKVFDGLRHDSGCPFEWTQKALDHYRSLGIDPTTKRLVYSNELNVDLIQDLALKFKDQASLAFGWGTNLTNDLGVPSLSIVMKLVQCNGLPVAKLSDDKGKTMCEDKEFLDYLKKVYNY